MMVKQNRKMRVFLLLVAVFTLCALVFSGCLHNSGGNSENNSPTQPEASSSSPTIPAGAHVYETLKNGATTGTIAGSYQWTSEGLQFSGTDWYLKYQIPTTTSGYLEFNAKGFRPREYHREFRSELARSTSVILAMWNDVPPYRNNDNLVEVRHMGLVPGREDATDSIKMVIEAQGKFVDDPIYTRFPVDRDATYRLRVEWGDGQLKFFRDGNLVRQRNYTRVFSPNPHVVYIGCPPSRGPSPEGLLISDVNIGIR